MGHFRRIQRWLLAGLRLLFPASARVWPAKSVVYGRTHMIQIPTLGGLESCATNLPIMNGLPSSRCCQTSRVADWVRQLAMKKGAWANIPPRSNRSAPICFSPYLCRSRNRVERFFNRIKQCRRVATRYDKLAANYLAFVQLGSIRLWLRANESTP